MMLSDEEIQDIRNRAKLNSNRQIDPMSFARDIERAVLAKAQVPDAIALLQRVAGSSTESIGNESSKMLFNGSQWHAGYVIDEIVEASPAHKQEPVGDRVTVQDVREIIEGYLGGKPKSKEHDEISYWLEHENGLAILQKINTNNAPPQAAAIPEGWQLVPVEPTGVMKDAGNNNVPLSVKYLHPAAEVYRAMLSAAPKQHSECDCEALQSRIRHLERLLMGL